MRIDKCNYYNYNNIITSNYQWHKLGEGWVIYNTPDKNIYIIYIDEYNVRKLFLCITHMFNNIEDTIQEMEQYGFCR